MTSVESWPHGSNAGHGICQLCICMKDHDVSECHTAYSLSQVKKYHCEDFRVRLKCLHVGVSPISPLNCGEQQVVSNMMYDEVSLGTTFA